MKHKVMVGLYFLAGGMWISVALRDIFAPGFLAMNGRVISKNQIIFEFAAAVVFLTMGVLSMRRHDIDVPKNQ